MEFSLGNILPDKTQSTALWKRPWAWFLRETISCSPTSWRNPETPPCLFLGLFPNTVYKKLDQKELLPDWKFLSHQKSSARCGRTHLALPRLHSHVLSCTAINVTTGMHIHSQYTECTMSSLFFGREISPQHVNCLILPVSAHFQKYKDRRGKLRSDFTHFMSRQKAKHSASKFQHSHSSLKAPGSRDFASKVGITLHEKGGPDW